MTPKTIDKNCRIGLALSGGGARGFAHAGALKAIEEAGLTPSVIAGVSAGSVISVLYAAGLKPTEIMKIFEGVKFSDFVRLKGNGSFFRIDKFKNFILEHIKPYTRLEDLPIETHIGVTDLDHGAPCAFNNGDIGDIMKASCSIPIVFEPVTINNTRYVDGGVLHNLPAWTIRDKCDLLIGINCSPLITDTSGKSIIDIAMRTFSLMSKANQSEDMALCDIAIELRDIAHYKIFNLKDIRKVFISGYAATKRTLRDFDISKYNGKIKTNNLSTAATPVEQQ